MALSPSKIILGAFMGALLSGCVPMPPKAMPPLTTSTDAAVALQNNEGIPDEAWQLPAVTESGRVGITVLEPLHAPDKILSRTVDIQLEPGSTLGDVGAVLGLGLNLPVTFADTIATTTGAVPTVVAPGTQQALIQPQVVGGVVPTTVGQAAVGLGQAAIGTMLPTLAVPTPAGLATREVLPGGLTYKGKLAGFLKIVSAAADVHFTWHGGAFGVFRVTEKERYAITAPQESNYIGKIASELSALGIEAKPAETGGFVIIMAKPSDLPLMREHIRRVSRNAAIINLQVGVYNVSLNKSTGAGVDWSRLSLLASNPKGAETPPFGSPALPTGGWQAGLSGQSYGVAATMGKFSAGLLLTFLDKYGTATTLQNTSLTTVAGKEVQLDSTVKTPYVSSVGVAGVGAGSSTAATATTATADSGVTLRFTPQYDADSQLVTVNLNLRVNAVVSNVTLSAGTLGDLTQPTTQEQTFNGVLRLRPGETAIIGGVRYRSSNSDLSGIPLPSVSNTIGQDTKSDQSNEMFILVRPTITVFGKPNVFEGAQE